MFPSSILLKTKKHIFLLETLSKETHQCSEICRFVEFVLFSVLKKKELYKQLHGFGEREDVIYKSQWAFISRRDGADIPFFEAQRRCA